MEENILLIEAKEMIRQVDNKGCSHLLLMALHKINAAIPNLPLKNAIKIVESEITQADHNIELELRSLLKQAFLEHNVSELLFTLDSLNNTFFGGQYDRRILRRVLSNNLKAEMYHEFEYSGMEFRSMAELISVHGNSYDPKKAVKKFKIKRYSYPKWEDFGADGNSSLARVWVTDIGRPYVFRFDHFVDLNRLS